MPSIYPTLKHSDRKFIRTEKARIRRDFSDAIKQKEMISELYQRLLPQAKLEVAKEATAAGGVSSEGGKKPAKKEVKKVAAK